MPGCMLMSGRRRGAHHRLRGLLQHVVLEETDDLAPEAAFLQMGVDVDDQFVVVVGQRLLRGMGEIVAGVRFDGDFGKFAYGPRAQRRFERHGVSPCRIAAGAPNAGL